MPEDLTSLIEELSLIGPRSAAHLLSLPTRLRTSGEPWGVLVGAGLSVGSGIPSWDALAAELGHRYKIDATDVAANGLPKVLQECLDVATQAGQEVEFWNSVADEICKGDPGVPHQLLMEIPFDVYLTINVECLLKRQHDDLVDVKAPRWSAYPNLAATSLGGRHLMQLHGMCAEGDPRLDPNTVVMTRDGYRMAYEKTRLTTVLTVLFEEFKVLIVGTSFRDRQIQEIVRAVRDRESDHARLTGAFPDRQFSGFALVGFESPTASDELERSYEGYDVGIDVIGYRCPNGDHSALTRILSWIAERSTPAAGISGYQVPSV